MLHVSHSSSVRHQEFLTVHTANLYDIYLYCVYSEKTPDDGQRNCPKHVEFYSKNKFEKLVHLVFIMMHGHLNVRLTTIQHKPSLEVTNSQVCIISGIRREVDETCPLLGYYAAGSGNSLTTFRDNLSAPFSRGQNSWSLKKGPIGCPETSVRNYRYPLRNSPEELSSLRDEQEFNELFLRKTNHS